MTAADHSRRSCVPPVMRVTAVVLSLSVAVACSKQESPRTAPTGGGDAAGEAGGDTGGDTAGEAAPAPAASRPTAPARPASADERGEIRFELATRTDWVRVSDTSAVPVRRALRPDSGEPYDASSPDVTGMRRGFHFAQTNALVGEPLLVELRVGFDGPGEWREPIGGNYRGRGRDDNFVFLLRHEDGTWLPDYYTEPAMVGGGISSTYPVKAGAPISYWLTPMRWASIARPGRYDLYCFQLAHPHDTRGWRDALADAIPVELRATHALAERGNELVDATTGKPTGLHVIPKVNAVDPSTSPVWDHIPAEVRARIPDARRDVVDYAHFELTLRAPSARQRRAMVKRWTAEASVEAPQQMLATRVDALQEALWFVPTTDFLPLLESWLQTTDSPVPQYLDGLVFNPHPEGVAILRRHCDAAAERPYYCDILDRTPAK